MPKPKKKGRCALCDLQIEVTHIHHIVFRSEEGSNKLDNQIEVCPNCHNLIHYGNLKVNALRFSTGGWLVEYEENGETKMKLLGKKDLG